jgi:hypothetical protein
MITQVILWSMLAVVGCAAFAALGVWAHVTDKHYRAQRRSIAEQAIRVPSQVAAAPAETTRKAEVLQVMATTQGGA